jgi:hypothetical protein
MGTIDSALFSRLSGFAGLKALVSTRVYPPPAPQNAAYPLVTYQEIDRQPIHVMGRTAGVVHIRYQVDSWAETLAEAKAVAAQVEAALDNWAGTSANVVVKNSFLESGQSSPYDDAEGVHRYIQDFLIEYER